MSALFLYLKVPPQYAIPVGFGLDIGIAYIIAQVIRSFQ